MKGNKINEDVPRERHNSPATPGEELKSIKI
jgi:hypothetical protein